MTDDDVVLLLDRAAGLAPERLDREPVSAVARRRGRRRLGLAGAALAAVTGLGVVVVPGAVGGQQVLTPARGGAVGTEFFVVQLVGPASRSFDSCLPLPGAGLVGGPASLSPTAVVSAAGTPQQRDAVEQCLRSAGSVTAADNPDLRAVSVSETGTGLGPLSVTTGWTYSAMSVGRMHDLTLTNTSDRPVFVQDVGFGTVLETGLFAGIDCSATQYEGEVVDFCRSRYSPVALAPGASTTRVVQLSTGVDPSDPLPVGTHEVAVQVWHRTSAPFRSSTDLDDAVRGSVRLRYDVTAPSTPGASRAAFLPAPGPGQEALATGALSGDPATGCLWLERAEESVPLLLHSDTLRVDFSVSPFRLLDGDRTVAVDGMQVEVGGGGLGGKGGVPGCPVVGTPFAGVLIDVPERG